jgi:hypothetical protein
LFRLLGEGSEDRRGPREAEPFQSFSEPADRVEVGRTEAVVALEDDQHRHVVAALEVALHELDDLGRRGVRGQVAALPRRRHLVYVGAGEKAGENNAIQTATVSQRPRGPVTAETRRSITGGRVRAPQPGSAVPLPYMAARTNSGGPRA